MRKQGKKKSRVAGREFLSLFPRETAYTRSARSNCSCCSYLRLCVCECECASANRVFM